MPTPSPPATGPAAGNRAARLCLARPGAAAGHPALHPRRRRAPCSCAAPAAAARPPCSACSAACRRPTAARCACSARTSAGLAPRARDRYRVDHSGYIFQQFNLLPFLIVRDNVACPAASRNLRAQRARQRHGSVEQAARQLLERLGLAPELHERRADSAVDRPAAARGRGPRTDRPAGAGDRRRADLGAGRRQPAQAFLELLFAECRAAGASLLFVSHDRSLAPAVRPRACRCGTLNRAACAPAGSEHASAAHRPGQPGQPPLHRRC